MKKLFAIILGVTSFISSLAQCPTVFEVSGNGAVGCSTGAATVTLSGSEGNVYYQLIRNGSSTGKNGTGAALTWTVSSGGTYTVIARYNSSGCQVSMNGSVVIGSSQPTVYSVNGGGTFCGEGINVELSDSQVGVNYQLKINDENYGNVMAGTGNKLIWYNQNVEGEYQVFAYWASAPFCNSNMSGAVTVIEDPKITLFQVTGGGAICGGGSVTIQLSGSEPGINYYLKRDGTSYMNKTGTGGELNFNVSNNAPGTYTIECHKNQCVRQMPGSAKVIVPFSINYVLVNGGGEYCGDSEGVTVYLTTSQMDVSYQLKINGVNSGSPIEGTGDEISWINQRTEGTYTVDAFITGASECGIVTMHGTRTVVENPKLNLYQVTGGGVICGSGTVTVGLTGSQSGINYVLKRNGSIYQSRSGTGDELAFTLNQNSPGTYTIEAQGSCTRTMQGSVDVAVSSFSISRFSVGGGGQHCSDVNGVDVYLNDSQTGVSYQLKVNDVNSGEPIAGTGNQLRWTNQRLEGNYTVEGFASGASACGIVQMNGSVTVAPLLNKYQVTGGGLICQSGSVTITLNESQTGISYRLLKEGGTLGDPVYGTGGPLTWTMSTSGYYDHQLTGVYSVQAEHTSTGCVLIMTGNATVTFDFNPNVYTLNGGGNFCEGEAGVQVYLNGSEQDVSYQLKVNGVNIGPPLQGTNDNFPWDAQTTPGTYTVLATKSITGCSSVMNGSPVVVKNPLPIQYQVSGGGYICDYTNSVTITLSNSQSGMTYNLLRNGSNEMTKTGNGSALIFTGINSPGTYTIRAFTSNGCSQVMTGNAVVTRVPRPSDALVQGGGTYCAGDEGLPISVSYGDPGVSYQLKVNEVNSGLPITGAGQIVRWPNQTAAGTYTVYAVNQTTGCALTLSSSTTVTIDIRPTKFQVGGGGSYCTGNNGVTITLSGSETGIVYQLEKNGIITAPIMGTGSSLTWINQTSSGTYKILGNNMRGCSEVMNGTATVAENVLPVQYPVEGGGSYCTGGNPLNITLGNSQAGVNYQLKRDGVNEGTIKAGTGSMLTWQSQLTGVFTISATNTVANCSRDMSGSATITLFTVSISGPPTVGSTPITLSSTSGSGFTYQWKRDGDNLSSQSSSSLQVSTSGNYEVIITKPGCSPISATQFVSNEAKANYNGLISSMRWRTDKAHNVVGSEHKGMYIFQYDDKYQVKEAAWAIPNFTLNTFANAGNTFRVSDLTYDPNGNIGTLKRYNDVGTRLHNFNYTYEDNKNKLTNISGYVNAYTYNALGQMVGEDKVQGDDQYVEYDVSGKVRKVFSDAAMQILKVEFIYDDRGFRLAKKNYARENNTNVLKRSTWYVRDALGNVLSVFEENNTTGALTQTEIPMYGAGKLGTYYPQQDGSAEYELTDHLGNVRALVREDINAYTATIEDNGMVTLQNPRVEEPLYFQNIAKTADQNVYLNHTPPGRVENPNKSSYLYWVDGMTGMQAADKSVGPAIALQVKAGDKLDIETWARYERKTSYARDFVLTTLTSFLGNSFLGKVGFDGLSAPQIASNMQGALVNANYPNDGTDGTRPFAYLNYIIYDNNKVAKTAGWLRVSDNAGFYPNEMGLPNDHEHLKFAPIEVAQNGYIYVWVSNQSQATRVWFDDLTVSFKQTIVTQATDYGVWGDVIREQKTDPAVFYKHGYQGPFSEKDLETGWNHFELREYDPVVGRWLIPDPYRQHWSPYLAMGNNPVNNIDPDGGIDGPGEEDPLDVWIRLGLPIGPVVEVEGERIGGWPSMAQWFEEGYFLGGDGGYYFSDNRMTGNDLYMWMNDSWQWVYNDAEAQAHYASQLSAVHDGIAEGTAFAVTTAMGGMAQVGMQSMAIGGVRGSLLRSANVLDKGGFTAVGRALQKHGSRPGSLFPKAVGSPVAMNAQGEAVLKGILTNPNTTSVIRHHARFGNVLEFKIPGGQGVRFSSDGKTFLGFLE